MPFDSFSFLLFFISVLLLDRMAWRTAARKPILLVASWIFYAGWNPYFLPMLIATSTFDWWLGQKLMAAASKKTKNRWLLLSLLSNLGVLAFFKYRFFIASNLDAVFDAGLLSSLQAPGTASWVLPVGISFYTFQSLSYCIDAYRGQLPEKPVSWLDFSLYVAFFPQLVAGPIVRFSDFYPQLARNPRSDAAQLGSGIALIIVGLFLKVVGADSVFAPSTDVLFASSTHNFHSAWLAAMAFTGQIFCDFAGYSLCAIGAARALGFWLPENFNAPYSAIGFSDFWRRWHISLSSWLRDYLYIPLGGNRLGALRTYVALSLTMLLGGLWHGAAWTFVAWGALHGLYLVLERLLGPTLIKISARQSRPIAILLRGSAWLLTLLLVMFAWVWFRAADSAQALAISAQMLAPNSNSISDFSAQSKLMASGFLVLIALQLAQRRFQLLARLQKLPPIFLGLLLGLLLTAIVLSPGNARAFIYFQF